VIGFTEELMEIFQLDDCLDLFDRSVGYAVVTLTLLTAHFG
jgi:hypothetical protein